MSERVNIGEPLLSLHFRFPHFPCPTTTVWLFGYFSKQVLIRCRLQDRSRAQVGDLGSNLRKHQWGHWESETGKGEKTEWMCVLSWLNIMGIEARSHWGFLEGLCSIRLIPDSPKSGRQGPSLIDFHLPLVEILWSACVSHWAIISRKVWAVFASAYSYFPVQIFQIPALL